MTLGQILFELSATQKRTDGRMDKGKVKYFLVTCDTKENGQTEGRTDGQG
jgi:hypothetical protein